MEISDFCGQWQKLFQQRPGPRGKVSKISLVRQRGNPSCCKCLVHLTAITWMTTNCTPWIFLRLAPGRRHSLTPLLQSVSLRYPACSTPHLVSPQHTGFERDAKFRTLLCNVHPRPHESRRRFERSKSTFNFGETMERCYVRLSRCHLHRPDSVLRTSWYDKKCHKTATNIPHWPCEKPGICRPATRLECTVSCNCSKWSELLSSRFSRSSSSCRKGAKSYKATKDVAVSTWWSNDITKCKALPGLSF